MGRRKAFWILDIRPFGKAEDISIASTEACSVENWGVLAVLPRENGVQFSGVPCLGPGSLGSVVPGLCLLLVIRKTSFGHQ